LLAGAKIPTFRLFGAGCAVALSTVTYWGMVWGEAGAGPGQAGEWEGAILVLSLCVLMVRQFPQKHNVRPVTTIAGTLMGVLYAPFLLGFLCKLTFLSEDVGPMDRIGMPGFLMLVYPISVAKLADAGAYFTGKRLGRHLLFPRLSPGKTWEGAIGGVGTGLLISWLFMACTGGRFGAVQVGWVHATILGVLLPSVGVVGDLAESLLKRAGGAKDSGSILPGTGGMLDLLDSVLFAAPIFFIYTRCFLMGGSV
jgi:phosphatidate cytidylyltransferase